jgi:hypothetical protein
MDMVQEFGMGIVMMPMVSILQHLAIAKHYAGQQFSQFVIREILIAQGGFLLFVIILV